MEALPCDRSRNIPTVVCMVLWPDHRQPHELLFAAPSDSPAVRATFLSR